MAESEDRVMASPSPLREPIGVRILLILLSLTYVSIVILLPLGTMSWTLTGPTGASITCTNAAPTDVSASHGGTPRRTG